MVGENGALMCSSPRKPIQAPDIVNSGRYEEDWKLRCKIDSYLALRARGDGIIPSPKRQSLEQDGYHGQRRSMKVLLIHISIRVTYGKLLLVSTD